MLNRLVSWLLPAVPRRAIQRVARRYISGETAESAIRLAASLKAQGYETTLDMLGEDTVRWEQAAAATEGYLSLMADMARAPVTRNVSLKLSQLGLRLDPERSFAALGRILDVATAQDFFVRIDMEDATLTDLTLEHHRRARQRWSRVGTVLQARLRRTLDDARELAASGASIRLCKGIYLEHKQIAHRRRGAIRQAYLEAAQVLLAGEGPVALATHDPWLIQRLLPEIDRLRPQRQGVEFQALLGVPMARTLERLRADGFPVRLYLPFGEQWYAYSVRRLRENPHMAGAVARSLLSRDHLEVPTTSVASSSEGPALVLAPDPADASLLPPPMESTLDQPEGRV